MNEFIPENDLDKAIRAMRRSASAFPDFCRALIAADLCVLIPYHPEVEGEMLHIKNGSPFPFALLKEEKGEAVPVFSSEERVEEGLERGKVPPRTYSVADMPAKQLCEILGTTEFGLVINKSCSTGQIVIWPDLMRDLASGKALQSEPLTRDGTDERLNILDPADYPTDLVQRTFEFMRQHRNFRAAWLLVWPEIKPPRYQMLVLMEPRDEKLVHELSLVAGIVHTKTYETNIGLLDERDTAYIRQLFGKAPAFFTAADYQRPPGAKL